MGFFDNFPWTNFHELNLDWIIRTMKSIKESLDKLWKEFLLSRVPTGGDEGDVLTKTDIKDYAMTWKKPTSKNGLPAGGADGQYLKKTGVADYSASWADLPESRNVPVGGVPGNVLTKTGVGDDDYNWQEPAASHDIPAGGTTGQVLKKSSDEDYATEWADESGGGGLPEGGEDGQIIKKVNGAAQWADAPLGVPASGNAGTFLKRTGPEAESYDFVQGWLPEQGPTQEGQVLKSTGEGTADWVSGGEDVITAAAIRTSRFDIPFTLDATGKAIYTSRGSFINTLRADAGLTSLPANFSIIVFFNFYDTLDTSVEPMQGCICIDSSFTGRDMPLNAVMKDGSVRNVARLQYSSNGNVYIKSGDYAVSATSINRYLTAWISSNSDLHVAQ